MIMSESNTECNILHLNDDCFYEIYKNLPIIDWCSLRETCTRLQSFSDDCFGRHIKTFELNGKCISGSPYDELTMNDIKRFIRNFGKFITKISVNRNVFDQDDHGKMVPLLDRYCVALEDLKLVKIEFSRATIERCALFSKLHRLVIDKCCDDEASFTACLTHCRSVKELELIRLYNIEGSILANNFMSLESFSIKSCNDFEYNFMQNFFIQNPQLKSLKLIECTYLADRLVQDIAKHLPNLEALSLRFKPTLRPNFDIMTTIMPLAKLKRFEMDFVSFEITNFEPFLMVMATHKNIEHLHLATVRFSDGLTRTLCELKTLKILKFTSSVELDGSTCKKLATELPLLTEIHIIECLFITFNELKEFVEHSKSLKRIVVNRHDDDIPSLTKDMFSLLLETVQRTQKDKTLCIHLNPDDLRDTQSEFEWEGNAKILSEHAHEIKLLPLEEEDISTWYEYGSGGRKNTYLGGVFDDMDYHDEYDDMYDDDFDDVEDDFF